MQVGHSNIITRLRNFFFQMIGFDKVGHLPLIIYQWFQTPMFASWTTCRLVRLTTGPQCLASIGLEFSSYTKLGWETVRKSFSGTPLKINILNPKSWRFGLDDFPFFKQMISRFHVNFHVINQSFREKKMKKLLPYEHPFDHGVSFQEPHPYCLHRCEYLHTNSSIRWLLTVQPQLEPSFCCREIV